MNRLVPTSGVAKSLECDPGGSLPPQETLSTLEPENSMSVVRIKRGMDIPVHGAVSSLEITEAPEASLAALLPGEAVGIKTKILVREGDPVQVGTPLFLDRRDDEVAFTSPASGKVKVIHRGSRRAVLAVVVERDGNDLHDKSVDTSLVLSVLSVLSVPGSPRSASFTCQALQF